MTGPSILFLQGRDETNKNDNSRFDEWTIKLAVAIKMKWQIVLTIKKIVAIIHNES